MMVAEVMAPPIVSQPASRIPSSAVSRRDPGLQRGRPVVDKHWQ